MSLPGRVECTPADRSHASERDRMVHIHDDRMIGPDALPGKYNPKIEKR